MDPGNNKICILYTGGTIGMERVGDVDLPPAKADDFLDFAPELNDFVQIKPEDYVQLMFKDSTDVNHLDWTIIARAIFDRRNNGYAGFVIIHGTDTMHFTASAVAFALGPELNFPVVFTGAQTRRNVPHGDARINLVRACKIARQYEDVPQIAEVCIAFGDFLWRGCRSQKKDERRFDAFECPAFPPIAYITETIDIQPLAKKVVDSGIQGSGITNFRPNFSDGIFEIALIPGLEPETLMGVVEDDAIKGVALKSFGAGNVPSEGKFAFGDLIRRCIALHKPVLTTSQFPAGSTSNTNYKPGVLAREAGAIPTGNMTSAAATTKFRWVIYLVEEEISRGFIKSNERLKRVDEWMNRSYVGELGPLTTEAFTEPDLRL